MARRLKARILFKNMNLSGSAWDYVIVFLSGLVVSFTPCLYPVMPLTASYIARANTRGTHLKGFILSLIYVFGLALTYSALAVIAALTGRFFGFVQNHPLTYLAVAGILVVFGLIMLNVIRLPQGGIHVQEKIHPTNIVTVLLFGMTAGLVVSPCVAPVLGALLIYTASQQNIIRAVILLFIFSYGMGASLILVGTFSGFLSRLPRSGPWLLRIQQICAGVLFLSAGYFLIQAARLFFGI